MMVKVKSVLALFGLIAAFAPAIACAEVSDPAAQRIDGFDRSLVAAMKQGAKLGPQGRYKELQPAVEETFNLPLMARFAVGPAWTKLSPSDQASVTAAFTHYSVATYAKNFSSYNGEKFATGAVDTRGKDKLVHTQLTTSGNAPPVVLVYRMQQAAGGGWKVVDVYFNGAISELTTQRADFSSTVAAGGGPALAKKLNDQADRLLHGG